MKRKKPLVKIEANDAMTLTVINEVLSRGLGVVRVDKDKPNWFYEGEGEDKRVVINIRACKFEQQEESRIIVPR